MSTSVAEEKIQKLVDFALAFQHDPDFNRLVFPPAVLAKLAERGVTVKPKEYSAAAAVDKCFSMTTSETYTSGTVEVIDQTSLECSFPPLPPLVSPIETNETKTPELEDLSSSPAPDAAKGTGADVPRHEIEHSPSPPSAQTE
jgi:hypothetical protein